MHLFGYRADGLQDGACAVRAKSGRLVRTVGALVQGGMAWAYRSLRVTLTPGQNPSRPNYCEMCPF